MQSGKVTATTKAGRYRDTLTKIAPELVDSLLDMMGTNNCCALQEIEDRWIKQGREALNTGNPSPAKKHRSRIQGSISCFPQQNSAKEIAKKRGGH